MVLFFHGRRGKTTTIMTQNISFPQSRPAKSLFASLLLGIIFLFLFSAFCALGIWQVQRMGWKANLVMQVETRLHLPPRPAPPPAQWPMVTAENYDYMPVRISGHFLNDKEVLVNAVNGADSGYWVMTPLETVDGAVVFVNRGFVPMDYRNAAVRAAGRIEGETSVTGLLRMSEPKKMLWRKNTPPNERWVLRNTDEMAQARGLAQAAPYFIDADKTGNIGGLPVGGLTVVRFPDNHLVYAITWFLLAAGVAAATFFVFRPKKTRTEEED
ncbi:MAG: SurF1 family protein (Surfeit 1) [Candidatus Tokpelaia hoelldobleri]|uniref:SURF1-like protein n=1 Tax=Candidatus Tokpelaia hoelldobleri TaxID=1902579 RepID=A0A1U9JSR3_9HYPH|nr:MAG: SurF1 family protein (Surfeit 1) [Candidatus Tokpelaia hoelldoblerii]